MIIANGFPKSGTHLLMKTLEHLGLKRSHYFIFRAPNGSGLLEIIDRQKGSIRRIDTVEVMNTFDQFLQGHTALPSPSGFKVINIFRNPRNACISWLRWASQLPGEDRWPETEETLIKLITKGNWGWGPWPTAMLYFTKWISYGEPCVKFEEICHDGGASVLYIAQNLGLKITPARAAQISLDLYGNDPIFQPGTKDQRESTWSGKWSNWLECPYWTSKVEQAWQASDGPRVEECLGYTFPKENPYE